MISVQSELRQVFEFSLLVLEEVQLCSILVSGLCFRGAIDVLTFQGLLQCTRGCVRPHLDDQVEEITRDSRAIREDRNASCITGAL